MEKSVRFAQIDQWPALHRFLEQKGSGHRQYSHYTTLSVLRQIMTGRQWRFGSPLLMNDQDELSRIPSVQQRTLFFSCFTFMNSENMAMWGLYGIPDDEAVRICFPGKAMRQWVTALKPAETEDIACRVVLSDVVYLGTQHQKLYYNNTSNLLLRQRNSLAEVQNQLAGRLKHYAWKYEQECRLFLIPASTVSRRFLMAPIPSAVLEQMAVWYGPQVSSATQRQMDRLLMAAGLRRGQRSEFTGLIAMKKICDSCLHHYEKQEQSDKMTG